MRVKRMQKQSPSARAEDSKSSPPTARDVCSDLKVQAARNAQTLLSTEIGNGFVATRFCQASLVAEHVDPEASVQAIRDKVAAVRDGDMSSLEAMLVSQAVSLEAIANELFRRAAVNLGAHLEVTEMYLRLGLKAQAGSRANIEALVEMKNPRPVAFIKAKQANVANGPQQVNNGMACDDAGPSRAENSSNKLLAADNGERVD